MEQFLGEIRQVGFAFAPVGWLACDGRLLSIAEYSSLFALLGVTYGGDGQSTFGLPDLRGRAPLGQGTGPNGTYPPGALGGAEQVQLNVQQVPAHIHAIKASSTGTAASPVNASFGASAGQYQPTVTGSASGTMLTSTGGNQAHENRMPFLVVNYIIATEGTYPSAS